MTEKEETPGAAKSGPVYTIAEAVDAICGLEKDEFGTIAGFSSNDEFEFVTTDLVPSLTSLFRENLYFNEERYRIELGGYSYRNPFNRDDGALAAFPKIAYYRVWRENPSGMICPAWFTALHDADFEETGGEVLAPGEHAPEDFLECLDFWANPFEWDLDRGTQFKDESAAENHFKRVLERAERKQKAAIAAANQPGDGDKGEAADGARSTPAPASAPATSRAPECEAAPAEVICDGLTVEAVRGVLADYPALLDVIAAAAEVRAFPDGRDKGANTIAANINRRIKERSNASGQLWGRAHDKSGALSGEQKAAFASLFEPWSKGGRPTKQSAAKKAGREKPSD